MNQAAHIEMAKMFNGFPQGRSTNIEALLLTYEEDLTGISDQAIVETAQKYRRNQIANQSETFAPSIAEFITAARRQEEFISIRNRPRLPSPAVRPAPPASPEQRRTEEERQRQQKRMAEFHASYEREKDAKFEAKRADIRARYGMTPEVLASIKDQPLPAGMSQVGAALKKPAA
jgi:hypothetical protein